ncbi:hypothetical protein [Methanosphaerula palustris]|uniref:hypothetical protein n=1 Tax=Methanosphaerula palustris TaxID=475088 RepID=UPI0013052FF9|nr:hypothetical protein [Methanosphaerula palustris]
MKHSWIENSIIPTQGCLKCEERQFTGLDLENMHLRRVDDYSNSRIGFADVV